MFIKNIILFFVLSGVCFADAWWTVYLNEDGSVKSRGYNENTKPAHVLLPNEYPSDYVFPTNEFRFWKKSGADWVAMTTNEQASVIDAAADVKASTANWKTNTVDGETLADAFTALIICINKRLPGTNKITAVEFKTELKNQLKQ